jgi:replication fork clamp-binding protein CrfC
MAEQGIESEATFNSWLAEEKAYLHSLTKEPIQETLEMEYYQRLVNLNASQYVVSTMTAVLRC